MPRSCRLDFGTAPPTEPGGPEVKTNDILAMLSPEGERVPLQKVWMCICKYVRTYMYVRIYIHMCTVCVSV